MSVYLYANMCFVEWIQGKEGATVLERSEQLAESLYWQDNEPEQCWELLWWLLESGFESKAVGSGCKLKDKTQMPEQKKQAWVQVQMSEQVDRRPVMWLSPAQDWVEMKLQEQSACPAHQPLTHTQHILDGGFGTSQCSIWCPSFYRVQLREIGQVLVPVYLISSWFPWHNFNTPMWPFGFNSSE